ncbi:MAG: hypothetical protein Q9224_007050 [Gallowayella concinna]
MDSIHMGLSNKESKLHGQLEDPPRCRLMELPIELRTQIFSYILPGMWGGGTLYWMAGTTSLLATCKAIHDEAAPLMYGQGGFQYRVSCEISATPIVQVNVVQSTPDSYGAIPICCECHPFPTFPSHRYIHHVRKVIVDIWVHQYAHDENHEVEQVQAVNNQVEAFISLLAGIPRLQVLIVDYHNHAEMIGSEEIALRPLLGLRNVEELDILPFRDDPTEMRAKLYKAIMDCDCCRRVCRCHKDEQAIKTAHQIADC